MIKEETKYYFVEIETFSEFYSGLVLASSSENALQLYKSQNEINEKILVEQAFPMISSKEEKEEVN